MNKNYYDILQINQNASPEIIEKAYKTLVKKYHPDLQEENNKREAEEILKEINEAYEILSNPDKKALYDQNLKNETISQEDYDKMHAQNEELKEELNNLKNNINNQNSSSKNRTQYTNHNNTAPDINLNSFNATNKNAESQSNQENLNRIEQEKRELEYRKQQLQYQEQMEQARQKAYHDAYIQDLKNRGYRIRYKKSFKDYIKGIISIIIVIFILILLWHIPFIQNFFINLYENNQAIHQTVDIFSNLFN